MTIWEAIFLGLVQGITEFLPVSSSGHLVIAEQFMGITEPVLTFNAVIHFGSLVAVLAVYWRDIRQMIYGVLGGKSDEAVEGRKMVVQLIIATLPLVVAAILLRDFIDRAFSSFYITPIMLYVTGVLLWYAERSQRETDLEKAGTRHAGWMGLAQMLAMLPGLSRSGVTISAGMMAGLNREAAARFSFLMSIPANLGASLFEARGAFEPGMVSAAGSTALLAGTLAAGVSSYLAIALLLRFLKKGRLMGFAYYTWVLATVVLLVGAPH